MCLKDNERLDDLNYDGLKIIQNPLLYCFTSDSIILANMVKASSKDNVCDLCTGSGIIATIIATKTNVKKVVGVEIQEKMVDMAKRSVMLNHLEEKIEIIKSPVQEVNKILGNGNFSIVTVNPPYQKNYTGEKQISDEIAMCRHEISVTLEEIIDSANKLLKFGGKFYIIHQAKRLSELLYLMEKYNIKPKKLTLIQPKENKNIDTIIVEGIKGGKDGMIVNKPLIVFDNNNCYTEQIQKMYGKD